MATIALDKPITIVNEESSKKGFKASQLGQKFEMSQDQILEVIMNTPWRDRVYDIKILAPVISGGGRVITARIRDYEDQDLEWVIATVRGNDFVMITADSDETKLVSGGFAKPEMIEIQGAIPVGREHMKKIAAAVKYKINEVGYHNLPAYLGGKLGKEIEAYRENRPNPEKQNELQSHVQEEALATHMDFAELPSILAKEFPKGSDILPMGWPMSLREEFFELNQGEELYQYVSMIQSILYENYTNTTDTFVLEIWNKLALRFLDLIKSKQESEPEKYSKWLKVQKCLLLRTGEEPYPFQVFREYVGNLGFLQFLAGHRSIGVPVVNIDASGNLVEDEFSPVEFSIEFSDALNLSFMNATVGLLSASNPIAWGEQIVNAGDSRMVARNVMSTTYASDQTQTIDNYNNNVKQGIMTNLAMTFTRTGKLVKDKFQDVVAAGQHAVTRDRTAYESKNEKTGERPQRIELVSPSQTWAYWDDMALDFMSQSIYMLTTVALAEGISVQRYLMQQFSMQELQELESMLMSTGNIDVLRDYSENGQSVKWLPMLKKVWCKIFEILQKEFPNDEYINRGIYYSSSRLRTILEDDTPNTLEEYVKTKKGRAWEAVLNEFNRLGRSPEAVRYIEKYIQEIFTNIPIQEA